MLNSYRLDIFVVMCVLRLIKCLQKIKTVWFITHNQNSNAGQRSQPRCVHGTRTSLVCKVANTIMHVNYKKNFRRRAVDVGKSIG